MAAFRRWWLKRQFGNGEWAGLLRPAPPGEWISLDLETTGLDPKQDHILSLAAVPVRDGRVLTSERFERRIRADREFGIRSEERRVGKECVSTCTLRGSRDP